MMKSWLLDRLHLLTCTDVSVSEEDIHHFETLYDDLLNQNSNSEFEYKHDLPVYMFINYLIDKKNVVIHGSNEESIETFEPRESTLFTGKPIKAVFASTDALWSIFFAVVNRREVEGSIRNLCMTSKTKNGMKRYYYFSLEDSFKKNPYCRGVIYFLPKDSFKQGGIRNEWVSTEVVQPIATLHIQPTDFLFKDEVTFHRAVDRPLTTLVKKVVLNK